MADFCPSPSASSNSDASNTGSSNVTPKIIVANKQPGQLWKKIGIVGSVAVMGSQPVLAQIDMPAGEMDAPSVTAEATPFMAATPDAPEVSTLVAPPLVVSPEAAPPEFSPAPQPVPSIAIDAITSQVDIEITAPVPELALEPELLESEPAVELEDGKTADADATVAGAEEATDTDATVAEAEDVTTAEETTDANATVAEEAEDATDADATVTVGETISDGENVIPAVEIVTPSDVVPGAIPTVEDLASEFGGVFVDPTEYSEGETLDSNAPDVVVSERSTGCEYTVDAETLSGCGAGEDTATVASGPGTTISEAAINIGPVSISRSGVRFSGGATTVAGREFYNTVAKPLVELQAGESFIFPLAAPSPITSLFGWRWHPIHHTYRFHSGTDLGAPQGTPILATQSGQVSVADYLGGYGLTVILRHNDNTLESRYAHMSHMLVQPGEWVEQGEVIGLVGSTGDSTGPHLHFELRQLTREGWSAINPDDVLRYALANLNNRMDGRPLQALNIIPSAQAAVAQAALPKGVKTETMVKDVPHFRPAQPHAQ
ncbi:peptidoglycan DD-metalloendopeptidase family protein [Leptothoe sp. LEGE 181152]|nr:peptidoglycan DD-metalloendopeptidase family protein [Leptothoe sp. LEGE 181152]